MIDVMSMLCLFVAVLFGGFGIGMAFAFEKMEGHVLQVCSLLHYKAI